MEEWIKKSDVVKAFEDVLDCDFFHVSEETPRERIEAIPSADRPRGEWIFRREFVEDTPFTGYRCSNCNYWQGMGAWNFCPNCGAKMKGADDE